MSTFWDTSFELILPGETRVSISWKFDGPKDVPYSNKRNVLQWMTFWTSTVNDYSVYDEVLQGYVFHEH